MKNEICISTDPREEKKNMTPAVVDALERLKDAKNATLSFAPGVYHFYEEGCVEKYFAVSNNSAGMKKIIFPIFDREGLTIDGQGAVFVFHGVVFPFLIHGCKNIVLKNFIIDREFSPVALLTVHNKTEEGFQLLVDKTKSPFHIEKGGVVFEREGFVRSTLERKIALHGIDRWGVQYIFAGDCPDRKENLPAPHLLTDATEIEGGIQLTYRPDSPFRCQFAEGERVMSLLDGERFVDVILLDDSEEILVKNITVRRGLGMGVIGQRSKNIEIDGFSTDIEYYNEHSTLTADSMHFINCEGNLEVHNCHISHTMDDIINVHGIYTALENAEEDALFVALRHYEQFGFNPYKPGDRLELIHPQNLEVLGEFLVETSEFLDDGQKLKLRGAFRWGRDKVSPGCLVENPDRMPDVHLHHNHFAVYPHLRLSGGGEILVEDNVMECGMAALLGLDLAKYWYESGRIRHLVYRNNIFRNCNALGGNSFLTIGVDGFAEKETPEIHDTVEITGNVFEELKEFAIVASGVKHLHWRDNTFRTDKKDIVRINGTVEYLSGE